MPDTSPGVGASAALNRFWCEGKGLALWADTPTPYRSLVAALSAHGIPDHMIHGLAAEYYHRVKGVWPGKHDGAPGNAKNAAMDLHPKDRGV